MKSESESPILHDGREKSPVSVSTQKIFHIQKLMQTLYNIYNSYKALRVLCVKNYVYVYTPNFHSYSNR